MAQDDNNPDGANGGQDGTQPNDVLELAMAGVKSETLKQQLRSETNPERAIAMAQEIKATQGVVSEKVLIAIGVFIVGLVLLLITAPKDSVLTDAAASRPILMLIVILTTAVFGGALINASVFSKVSKDQFSNGREIFLFFSGISATVIGFYFGTASAEEIGAAPPSVSSAIEDNGLIAMRAVGKQSAWSAKLIADATALEMAQDQADGNRFTVGVSQTVCPAGGVFEVAGPMGYFRKNYPVTFTREKLAEAGWTKCADTPPAGPEPQAPAEDAEAEG